MYITTALSQPISVGIRVSVVVTLTLTDLEHVRIGRDTGTLLRDVIDVTVGRQSVYGKRMGLSIAC